MIEILLKFKFVKILLISLCVALCNGYIDSDEVKSECFRQFQDAMYKPHPDMHLNVHTIISKYGYPVETHKVITEDGYILTLFRIPGSPTSPIQSGHSKPAVYVNHGLFANSHIWILQHGSRNLAFKLADEGFDVWLGNCRGTSYSNRHRNLSPDDMEYWDFSFHEMGLFDIPAVIHHIRHHTKQEKIYYIGHSMGSTEFFIAMIKKPKLNDYISTAVMFAPVAYNHHATSIAKEVFAPIADELYTLTNDHLGGKFNAMTFIEENIGERLGKFCSSVEAGCGLCAKMNAMLFGHDPHQMNYTMQSLFFSVVPEVVSTKTLLHYSQIMNSGKFREFNYGSEGENQLHYGPGRVEPPEYNLTKITAPMVFIWSDNDNLATPSDVSITASKLRPGVLKENIRVNWNLWTHRDFINGIDADKLVYDKTVDIFKRELYG